MEYHRSGWLTLHLVDIRYRAGFYPCLDEAWFPYKCLIPCVPPSRPFRFLCFCNAYVALTPISHGAVKVYKCVHVANVVGCQGWFHFAKTFPWYSQAVLMVANSFYCRRQMWNMFGNFLIGVLEWTLTRKTKQNMFSSLILFNVSNYGFGFSYSFCSALFWPMLLMEVVHLSLLC